MQFDLHVGMSILRNKMLALIGMAVVCASANGHGSLDESQVFVHANLGYYLFIPGSLVAVRFLLTPSSEEGGGWLEIPPAL